ncbi:MAG: 50S ribosomal protein L5 [Candidatus Gribaldobacteria bacterium]|nr:50S ribosomal protein L5 [Candidatus Gribaldobacteria bacterium]
MLNLQEQYNKEVVPVMMKKFGKKSVMAVPKLKKVVINSGFGKQVAAKTNSEREKIAEQIAEYLGMMTGQKAVIRKAKKSVAAFKLREGMSVGACVTLRGKRMYDFLEKLIGVALPRIRDFRGLSATAFSEQGDFSIGFKEYVPFPELRVEKEKGVFGLEVVVANTAKNKAEGEELLRLLGFPIKK